MNKFDKAANSICEYMKEKKWEILVIGEPRIEKSLNSLKYNFELVFKFTGIKKDKKEEK